MFTSYMVVFILFMLTTVLLNRVSTETRNAEHTRAQQQSFWASEGAVDQGLTVLKTTLPPSLAANTCGTAVSVLSVATSALAGISSSYQFCNTQGGGDGGQQGTGDGDGLGAADEDELIFVGGGGSGVSSASSALPDSPSTGPGCAEGLTGKGGCGETGGEAVTMVLAIQGTGQAGSNQVGTVQTVLSNSDPKLGRVISARKIEFVSAASGDMSSITGAPVQALDMTDGIDLTKLTAGSVVQLAELQLAQTKTIPPTPKDVDFKVDKITYEVAPPTLILDCAPPAGAIDKSAEFGKTGETTIDLEDGEAYVVTGVEVNVHSETVVNLPTGAVATALYFSQTAEGKPITLRGTMSEPNEGVQASDDDSEAASVTANVYVNNVPINIEDLSIGRFQLFLCGEKAEATFHNAKFQGTVWSPAAPVIVVNSVMEYREASKKAIETQQAAAVSTTSLVWNGPSSGALASTASSQGGESPADGGEKKKEGGTGGTGKEGGTSSGGSGGSSDSSSGKSGGVKR